jgi:hypothetical protein
MKHYGVKEADLLPGLKVGNPELAGGAVQGQHQDAHMARSV